MSFQIDYFTINSSSILIHSLRIHKNEKIIAEIFPNKCAKDIVLFELFACVLLVYVYLYMSKTICIDASVAQQVF